MNDTADSKKGRKDAKANDREARLKAALKANMGKRKAQARARKAGQTSQAKGE